MKKILYYVLGFCVLLTLSATYFLFWGFGARRREQNKENSHRVRVGMPVRDALAIMGPSSRKENRKDYVVYYYDPQPLAADLISVSMGKDSLVSSVNDGDD